MGSTPPGMPSGVSHFMCAELDVEENHELGPLDRRLLSLSWVDSVHILSKVR